MRSHIDNAINNRTPKQIIASNIKLLLILYGKSRKQVCEELGISYTTFCDWYNGNTYPRIDSLDQMGYYFRIETKDFFVDIETRPFLKERLATYAKCLGVRRDIVAGGAIDFDDSEGTGNIGFTVEDYDETPEGYPVELINGEFFVMASPSLAHQRLVRELTFEITSFIKSHKGTCEVFPGPFDVQLRTERDTVAVPDITVVCDPSKLDDRRCIGAPDWIIEIVSKTNADHDYCDKLVAYEQGGVREYWIINPMDRKVSVYYREHPSDPRYLAVVEYSFTDMIPVGIYDGELRLCLATMNA